MSDRMYIIVPPTIDKPSYPSLLQAQIAAEAKVGNGQPDVKIYECNLMCTVKRGSPIYDYPLIELAPEPPPETPVTEPTPALKAAPSDDDIPF